MSALFAIGTIFPLTVIVFYLFAFSSMNLFNRLYFMQTWLVALFTAGLIIVKVDSDNIITNLLGILGLIYSFMFVYIAIFSVFLCDSGVCDDDKKINKIKNII
jgi:hypothetical protein